MIEIREKLEALREQFKTETGENYINSQGEPDIEYMAWIEERLVKESDSLPCVKFSLPPYFEEYLVEHLTPIICGNNRFGHTSGDKKKVQKVVTIFKKLIGGNKT